MNSMFKILTTIFIVLSFVSLNGQESDFLIKWSDKQEYNDKTNGYLDDIIGDNSKYIYVINNISRFNGMRKDKKLRIVAYDKNTMQKKISVNIKGFEENENGHILIDQMKVKEYVILENIIYVFWVYETAEKDELFVQSYTSELKEIAPLKKIYEVKSKAENNKKAELFVFGTTDGKVIVGGELSAKEDENIRLSIKILKPDLTFSSLNQIALPILTSGRVSNSLSSEYFLGKNNNLHVISKVSLVEKNSEQFQNYQSSFYYMLSVINPENGKIKSVFLKYDNKKITNLNYHKHNKSIFFSGLFTNLTKSKSPNGVFSIQYDYKLNTFLEPNFSSFTHQHIHYLKNKQKEYSFDYDFVSSITDINKTTLIYSKTERYSGNGGPYQKNYNIITISLNSIGDIDWVIRTERKAVYKGWHHNDIKAFSNNGLYYVLYADDYSFDPKFNRRVKKSKNVKKSTFNYLILNPKNGQVIKKMYNTNVLKESKDNKKYINIENIIKYNNNLYVNSIKMKMKPHGKVLLVILLPTVYGTFIPFLVPSFAHGYGYLGKIEIK